MPGIAFNALATSSREKPYMFNCLSSCLPSQLPSPKAALTAVLRFTHPTCKYLWYIHLGSGKARSMLCKSSCVAEYQQPSSLLVRVLLEPFQTVNSNILAFVI